MRKQYTAFPVDEVNPAFPTEREVYTPALKVRVGRAHVRTPRFDAIVDSGSQWCLFKGDVARFIGIKDITTGIPYKIGGIIANLREPIYFHKVKVFVEMDWVIEVLAGFMDKLGTAGILGRNGFFDNFVTKFDHTSSPPSLEIEKLNRA